MLGAVPAMHRCENSIRGRLQRNVEMTGDAVRRSNESNEVFGDVHGLDRAEADALKLRIIQNAAQKVDETCAGNQIAAVTAEMDSAEHNFAIAARDQGIQFFDDARGREAAAISANRRNYAESAAVITSVLNFQDRARVLRFTAFDRRDEDVGLREDVTDEDRSRARRRPGVGGAARDAKRCNWNEAARGGRNSERIASDFREARDFGFVRISDNENYARKRGEIFRSALRVAARGDDTGGGVGAMYGADRAARLSVGRSGDCAGVDHDDVGGGRIADSAKAARPQLAFDGGGIGLRGATTELFDEKGSHRDARAIAQRFSL